MPPTGTSSCSPARATRRRWRAFGWGRQAIDVAHRYGVVATAQEWMDVFKPLRPRQYSIASSPLTQPHHIRLVASIVRYRSR